MSAVFFRKTKKYCNKNDKLCDSCSENYLRNIKQEKSIKDKENLKNMMLILCKSLCQHDTSLEFSLSMSFDEKINIR